jgi:hypothetical protein
MAKKDACLRRRPMVLRAINPVGGLHTAADKNYFRAAQFSDRFSIPIRRIRAIQNSISREIH